MQKQPRLKPRLQIFVKQEPGVETPPACASAVKEPGAAKAVAKPSAKKAVVKANAKKAAVKPKVDNESSAKTAKTAAPPDASGMEAAARRVMLAKEIGVHLPPRCETGDPIKASDALKRCEAATGKTAKALRESFRRSFPSHHDPRVSDVGTRFEKATKMPKEVEESLLTQTDRDWWLAVFLENNSSWAESKLEVTDETQDVDDAGITYVWLMDAQMLDLYKCPIVKAEMQRDCMDRGPEWNRQHPRLKDISQAHQYKVEVDDSTRESVKKILRQSATTGAEIDNALASKMIRRPKQSTASRSAGSAPRVREDAEAAAAAAAEAEKNAEEAKKKEEEDAKNASEAKRRAELAAQKALVAADPRVQAQKWVKGLAELLPKLKSKCKDAETIVFPHNMQDSYIENFKNYIEKLKDIRKYLEEGERTSTALSRKLKMGEKLVGNVKDDMIAFDHLKSTYSKKK